MTSEDYDDLISRVNYIESYAWRIRRKLKHDSPNHKMIVEIQNNAKQCNVVLCRARCNDKHVK